jgi:hypothetical protein
MAAAWPDTTWTSGQCCPLWAALADTLLLAPNQPITTRVTCLLLPLLVAPINNDKAPHVAAETCNTSNTDWHMSMRLAAGVPFLDCISADACSTAHSQTVKACSQPVCGTPGNIMVWPR